MAKFSLKDALAHLRAHPPTVSDRTIALKATAIFRGYGIAAVSQTVSRPLVCMVRRGTSSTGETARTAWKARAVWDALVQVGAVPAIPAELQRLERRAIVGGRRTGAGDAEAMRRRIRELEQRLYGGSRQEVIEVPMLTKKVLDFYGFARNPVYSEIRSDKDVWWSDQHLEAKKLLMGAVEDAEFFRLSGDRGSGKSLVAELAKRELLKRDDVAIAEPSPVLAGMLGPGDLMTAVVQALKRRKTGREEVFAQAADRVRRSLTMQFLLKEAREADCKVALWIDEAHELARTDALLALKRFLDVRDARGHRLIGVVLIGQHAEVMSPSRTRDLSEVGLRMQTCRFEPMTKEIPDYLRFKIQRAGAKPSEVITSKGLEALAARCPYPLDANALFAKLLIEAHRGKLKPIGRDDVEEAAPEMDEAAE